MQTLKYFEALEALETFGNLWMGYSTVKETYPEHYATIKKSLKALEIIKEKKVNIGIFYFVVFILKADYNDCKLNNCSVMYNICDTEKDFLTKEEFDILKEFLE